MKKQSNLKLYQVNVSYFQEKTPYSQSVGGGMSYYISANDNKSAKEIGLKSFKKNHKNVYDNIDVKCSLTKIPACIKLAKEGLLEFHHKSMVKPVK